MRIHLTFSQSKEEPIDLFMRFDKEQIKESIVEHLTKYPDDIVEHCRDYSKHDMKKYVGYEIINFYGINPNNGKISKIVTRGYKKYYITLK